MKTKQGTNTSLITFCTALALCWCIHAHGVNCTNWSTLTNWTQTSAPSKSWTSIASSADGANLAASFNGGIYTSTNAGDTWTPSSAPNQSWMWIASSADGTRLAATAMEIGIYTSANSGATWTPSSAPTADWTPIACSADGTKLAAGVGYNGGGIYTSPNSGRYWWQTSAPRQ
jgi:photosystem II stability/assembly factor-like uncharacterized protein